MSEAQLEVVKVFKPQIIKIKGKDYITVQERVRWFRFDYPLEKGRILTEAGDGVVRAEIAILVDGVYLTLASGMSGIRSGKGQVWDSREVEKAETAAIGRALALAGYGTQFAGDDLDDSVHLSDSPVERANPRREDTPTEDKATEEPAQEQVHLVKLLVKPLTGNRKRLDFVTQEGVIASAFTRKLFKEAGWIGGDEWSEPGSHEFPTMIPATIKKTGNRWDIIAVDKAIPGLDTQEPPAEDVPF